MTPREAPRTKLVQTVEERLGLALHPGLRTTLERAGLELLAEGVARSPDELLSRVRTGSDADPVVVRMREAASIGETYFFRSPEQLDALVRAVKKHLVPAREARPRLRIWSAACATGEEVYSLAALLRRALPQVELRILGTDMNEASLEVARQGVYPARAFRGSSGALHRDAFIARGDRYEVRPELRQGIRFARLNLVTDAFPSASTIPGGFDVVVCRNVLIYVDPAQIPDVMRKIAAACAPRALVALTPVEHAAARHLGAVHSDGSAIYLLGAASAQEPQRPVTPVRPTTPVQRSEPERAAPIAAAPPPVSFEAALSAARAAADHGNPEVALRWLEQAASARPDAPEPAFLHGLLSVADGELSAAVAAFRRCLFLAPEYAPAALGLADALLASGLRDEAARYFRLALGQLALRPDAEVLEPLGITTSSARAHARHGLDQALEET